MCHLEIIAFILDAKFTEMLRKQIVLFFNAVLVRGRVYMFAAWIIYLEMFFFLNEFSAATVTGFGFCCHWRQKCWPFQAEDHIFHLILVCSDESKAVISPPAAERVGAQPRHRFTERGLMPGRHFMNGFLPGAHGAPQWSGSPAACLLATSDECLVEKDLNGLWPPRPLNCVSVCLSITFSFRPHWWCWACCLFHLGIQRFMWSFLDDFDSIAELGTEHLDFHWQHIWLFESLYLRLSQAVQFHHLHLIRIEVQWWGWRFLD